MLCLKWNLGETLTIGDAKLKFVRFCNGGVRIVVDAPKAMNVVRGNAKNKEPRK